MIQWSWRRLGPIVINPSPGRPLATAVAHMDAVVGNADSTEPFQRVGIGVADSVRAHSFHEVMSIGTDRSRPRVHLVIRWVMPGTVKASAPRRRMDRNGVMAHVKAFSCRASRSSRWADLPVASIVIFIGK